MFGLSFVDVPPVEPVHPARADVALFMGWTTRRQGAPLPAGVAQWLRERRYLDESLFERAAGAAWRDSSLLDMPLPIDSWSLFDQLFDWHARPLRLGSAERADDYLGLAVRDFFANGGRKCYVVRLGDPWPVVPRIPEPVRTQALSLLLPPETGSHWQREGWRGIEHAWALDEVSLVLVPDLPDLFVTPGVPLPPDLAQPAGEPEVFVECGEYRFGQPAVAGVRRIAAPRLDDTGWGEWNHQVGALRERLGSRRRDLMLLLTLPLSTRESRAARQPLAGLTQRSSMLQLATPWLRPTRDARTAEGLLPPDGTLAGLVAATVLARGAASSAAGRAPLGVLAVEPQPADELMQRHATALPGDDTLLARCALFGPTPDGVRLLSDRSASAVRGWEQAGVVRLLGQLLRTARQAGETLVFEASGERLWARIRGRFEDMLARFWAAGALRGATAAEAFAVHCDRSVMSQGDIDAGRVVVWVEFTPQLAIERVRVALALAEDGSVQWTDAPRLAEATP